MNKGSIWQRGRKDSNTWQIQILVNGKRYYETFHGTRRDAQTRLNKLLTEKDKGALVVSGNLTVGQHLDNWFKEYVQIQCGAWQIEGVRSIIKNHYRPAFADVPLKKLTSQMIADFYAESLKTLSGRTVNKYHRILKQSLKYAVIHDLIGVNPCDKIKAPRFVKKPMRTLTQPELEILFKIAESYPLYYPIIYFAACSGVREAEVLALRWRDLDLDLLGISVTRVLYKRNGRTEFRPPKTAHSIRRIDMMPKLSLLLRDYRANRELIYAQLGHTLKPDDIVFTREDFQPMHPSVLGHAFRKIADQAGLSKDVHFHTLRHTFASLMLQRGVSPKIISEALGHSSVAFTMDTYSHIIKGMQADAMKLLDGIMPDANFPGNYYKITTNVDNNGISS